MIVKTPGIVISYVRFKETSIIARIFTRELGLQSYVVNGVRSHKNSGKMALYQPMTLLDLVVYKNDRKAIQRISECRCEYPYQNIPYDMKKSAVLMFSAELLGKTVTEENLEDAEKYDFVRQFLIRLDESTEGAEHYPVYFGLHLSRFVGFEIETGRQLIAETVFLNSTRMQSMAEYFDVLLQQEVPRDTTIELRREALSCLLEYYDTHLDGFRHMKSVQVLKQLFS